MDFEIISQELFLGDPLPKLPAEALNSNILYNTNPIPMSELQSKWYVELKMQTLHNLFNHDHGLFYAKVRYNLNILGSYDTQVSEQGSS